MPRLQNYTSNAKIVRGGRWPAGTGSIIVTIYDENEWAEGADEWTWELLLSRVREGGTPDVTLTGSATVNEEEDDEGRAANTVMTITFSATSTETASLVVIAPLLYAVDIRSTDGEEEPSYWPQVAGTAEVRSAAGQG